MKNKYQIQLSCGNCNFVHRNVRTFLLGTNFPTDELFCNVDKSYNPLWMEWNGNNDELEQARFEWEHDHNVPANGICMWHKVGEGGR